MYWIGKKDHYATYGSGHLTWQSPAFRWRPHHPLSEARGLDSQIGKPGTSALQQLLKQLAMQEEEVVTLALRHARSSESFLDRMRGRYRQLLLPLQAEARRAIQFLMLQTLEMMCEQHPEFQTLELLVQRICDCPADTLRAHLADYYAHPTTPGEVFAHNVWELVHGPREKERFAVFALRMESCLRRLSTEFVPVLEACTITSEDVALANAIKED